MLALLANHIAVVRGAEPGPTCAGSSVSVYPSSEVLKNTRAIPRLNFGIFALHVLQTAMFLVVPRQLIEQHGIALGQHWHIYLPVVLGSFVLAIPAIVQSERKGRTKLMFVGSIALLLVSQLGLWLATPSLGWVVAMLLLFFAAFNILEACPCHRWFRALRRPRAKGTALGVFNTTQAPGARLRQGVPRVAGLGYISGRTGSMA